MCKPWNSFVYPIALWCSRKNPSNTCFHDQSTTQSWSTILGFSVAENPWKFTELKKPSGVLKHGSRKYTVYRQFSYYWNLHSVWGLSSQPCLMIAQRVVKHGETCYSLQKVAPDATIASPPDRARFRAVVRAMDLSIQRTPTVAATGEMGINLS